jgi:hypothetical protein
MVSETMVKGKVPALRLGPATRRALQLDALAAILPMDRRDWLAELVTDDDFETLDHLARRYEAKRPWGARVGSRLFWRSGRTPPPARACVPGDGGARVEIHGT